MPRSVLLASAAALALSTQAPPAQEAPAHPLDALTAEEIARVRATLADAGHVAPETRFPTLTLREPSKEAVRGWRPGAEAPPREAFAVLRTGPRTQEAVVSLDEGEVAALREVEGVQTNILLEEWETALTATVADPEWQEAMRARGYESFDQLFCAPLTVGWFGEEADEQEGAQGNARVLKVPCFDTQGASNNLWGRPIEGLYTVVDLGTGRVIEVVDNRVVPTPAPVPPYGDGAVAGGREALRPVAIHAPEGANYALDGGMVDWQNWRFHLRMDRRVGPVVSLVSFDDAGGGGERRDIAYQITLSEMFVPYMDPDDGWYFRSYMDIGEYGFGLLASRLRAGVDCPEGATFLDATLADDAGEPFLAEDVMCLFERNTGNPGWRHAEAIDGTFEGRPEVELVVRTVPTVGNYDYVVDHVFTQRGELRVDVGATGIDAVKGVETARMSDPTAEEDTRYGALVAPNLVAVHHDHYISFRLDLDVDGPENTLMRGRITPTEVDGPRTSIWTLEEAPVAEEGPIGADAHGAGPESWTVVNPNRETALGHNPGYQIEAGHGAVSLLSPEDHTQRRAAFSAAPLWLTTHRPEEQFAAGDYPNQSRGGDGLPAFADGEATENQDLVLWYTVGFHHLTRAEDWPVLPTKWHGFRLRPYNFFDRNPSIDVPTAFQEAAAAR